MNHMCVFIVENNANHEDFLIDYEYIDCEVLPKVGEYIHGFGDGEFVHIVSGVQMSFDHNSNGFAVNEKNEALQHFRVTLEIASLDHDISYSLYEKVRSKFANRETKSK